MEISTLVLAYGAAAMIALVVTAAFSAPIEEVLFRLLPREVAPAWQEFLKFALFVISFVGGMPGPLAQAIVDPGLPAPPQTPGEGLMIVMGSVSGALMAAAWTLLAFFGVTLTALVVARVHAALRRRREPPAPQQPEKPVSQSRR